MNKVLNGGMDSLGNTLETDNINLHDGLNTLTHHSLSKNSLRQNSSKGAEPTHHYHQSRLLNNNYSGPGVLNFATMSARKPITEGFYNPHDERFVLPQNQFPEILTKHHHMPKVYIKGFAKRNSSKHFLTTPFTGLINYQKEVPAFYPNQPGYSPNNEVKDRFTFDPSKLNEHSPLPKRGVPGAKVHERIDAESNPLIRELLRTANSTGSVPSQSQTFNHSTMKVIDESNTRLVTKSYQ